MPAWGPGVALAFTSKREMSMRAVSVVPLVLLLGLLSACDGEDEQVETAEVSVVDTSRTGMPGAGMPGEMGRMPGMGEGAMMMSDWERHMAAMHGASGESLRAMMGPHRQMAMRMIETMDSTRARTGMPMDSAWMATRDSLREDLARMQGMSPEQAEALLDAHDARMRRMLEMHGSTPAAAPR